MLQSISWMTAEKNLQKKGETVNNIQDPRGNKKEKKNGENLQEKKTYIAEKYASI